jgi:hypothetical protein
VQGGPHEPGIGVGVLARAGASAYARPDRFLDEGEGGDGLGGIAGGGEHEPVACQVIPGEPHVGAAGGEQGADRVALLVERGLYGVA